jgi:hypothetical protein
MAIIYKHASAPKKNDILSFFFGESPMDKALEEARQEIKQLRQANKDLEAKLFLYVESGDAHIHRMMFRTYMMAALDRKETDSEWINFLATFSFSSLPLSIKIYEWIDRFIEAPVTLSIKEMKMDLDSVSASTSSSVSASVDSQTESTLPAFEFRPIRIELESWPSDESVKTDGS